MSDCPRVISKEAMEAGLKAGRKLCVDRRDAPELVDLLEWEKQGLVKSVLVQVDEQSSYQKFWWIGEGNGEQGNSSQAAEGKEA